MPIFACNSLKLSFKLLSMTDVGNHHEDQRIKVPKNLVSKFLILGNFWQYLVSLGNFSVFCEQNRDRPSRCMSRYLKYPPPATSRTVSSCLKLSQAFSNLAGEPWDGFHNNQPKFRVWTAHTHIWYFYFILTELLWAL